MSAARSRRSPSGRRSGTGGTAPNKIDQDLVRQLARHHEVLERLSRAVAGACRETDPSRHDPPPLGASFIVGGIEEALRRRLSEHREELLWEDLRELVSMLLGAPRG